MAKSIYETLAEGRLEVEHKGEKETFEMPEWLSDCVKYMDEPDQLVGHLIETSNLHGLLHAGLQQAIIDLRATIRPGDQKNPETGEREPVSLIADSTNAQRRANSFKMKPIQRPGTKSAEKNAIDLKKALVTLVAKGYDVNDIVTMTEAQIVEALKG